MTENPVRTTSKARTANLKRVALRINRVSWGSHRVERRPCFLNDGLMLSLTGHRVPPFSATTA